MPFDPSDYFKPGSIADFSEHAYNFNKGRDLPPGVDPYGFSRDRESFNSRKNTDWAGNLGRFAGQALRSYTGQDNSNAFGRYGAIGGVGFGGGIQQAGDLTAVYPQQSGPYTIEGSPGKPSKWGKLGALAGAAIAAPFTGGMSLAAAAPIIGGAASLGGTAGSLFDS